MKKNKLIALLAINITSVFLSTGCGSKPVDTETPVMDIFSDYTNNIILNNQRDEVPEIEENTSQEEPERIVGNGTGDTPDVETEEDYAYEEQIALEEDGENHAATTLMYATGDVNVRDKASTSAGVIGKYRKNDIIPVYEINGDWAAINYNDAKAYVNAAYLSNVKVTEDSSANSKVRDDDAVSRQSASGTAGQESSSTASGTPAPTPSDPPQAQEQAQVPEQTPEQEQGGQESATNTQPPTSNEQLSQDLIDQGFIVDDYVRTPENANTTKFDPDEYYRNMTPEERARFDEITAGATLH